MDFKENYYFEKLWNNLQFYGHAKVQDYFISRNTDTNEIGV